MSTPTSVSTELEPAMLREVVPGWGYVMRRGVGGRGGTHGAMRRQSRERLREEGRGRGAMTVFVFVFVSVLSTMIPVAQLSKCSERVVCLYTNDERTSERASERVVHSCRYQLCNTTNLTKEWK